LPLKEESMATVEEIAQLRLLIAEPTEDTYSDEVLSDLLDASASANHAALEIWTQKAAAYTRLVDISEGGSQRKNSDLLKNALLMAEVYQNRIDVAALAGGRTKIAKLTR
jgi:hypothetical protein